LLLFFSSLLSFFPMPVVVLLSTDFRPRCARLAFFGLDVLPTTRAPLLLPLMVWAGGRQDERPNLPAKRALRGRMPDPRADPPAYGASIGRRGGRAAAARHLLRLSHGDRSTPQQLLGGHQLSRALP
jgi:hypothetical protein